MAHIDLTRAADASDRGAGVSADFIAKLANGRADDLLSLLCLARPIERCPLLVAPAMNREMWAHPATQRNVAQHARRRRAGARRRAAATRPAARSATAACSRRSELRDEVDRVLPAQGCWPGTARADHRRPHLRADRSGARHHQPVQRQDGLRDRARRAEAGADVHAGRRPGAPADAARRAPHRRRAARSRCTTPCCRWPRGTTCSSPPLRWPTGARRTLRERKIKKDGTHSRAGARAAPRTPTSWPRSARLPQRPVLRRLRCREPRPAEHARAKLERKNVPLIVGNLGPATFGRDDNALLLVDAARRARNCRSADKLTPGARSWCARSRRDCSRTA